MKVVATKIEGERDELMGLVGMMRERTAIWGKEGLFTKGGNRAKITGLRFLLEEARTR